MPKKKYCNYVDPNQIYIIGHSMGAMLASEIEVAGLILMAGSPKTMINVMITQNTSLLEEAT